jgi:hypothetical protein
MKGFIALLMICMIGLAGFNWWQIRELRQDIVRLEEKVQQQQSSHVSDELVAKAVVALAQAREAVANTDWNKAKGTFDSARANIDAAVKTANAKAGPTLRWLQGQAQEIGKQIQDRVPQR